MEFNRLIALAALLFFAISRAHGEAALSEMKIPAAWTVPCSTGAAAPVLSVPFSDTETLHYAVSWAGIRAGDATIAVKGIEPLNGEPTYHLSMHLETTGVTALLHRFVEQTDTWVDTGTLLTARYTKQTREAHYLEDQLTALDQQCHRLARHEHRIDKNEFEDRQSALPDEPSLDTLGYLFYVRAQPLSVGSTFNITLVSGDHLWPVTVRVKNRLKIASGAKWYDCFYIEPELRDRTLSTTLRELQVWISADQKHLLVRLRMEANVGHIVAELNQ